jgi:hypothetical protein
VELGLPISVGFFVFQDLYPLILLRRICNYKKNLMPFLSVVERRSG